jgi:hypothetical protein
MKKPDLPPIKINIISLIKLYRLVKKLIRQLNQKAICLKKKTTPFIYKPHTALSFAINDYQGTQNDLNGCVNDQTDLVVLLDLVKRLSQYHSDFAEKNWKDKEVTRNTFKGEVGQAIDALPNVPVVFISDSCFSGTNTRLLNSKPRCAYNPNISYEDYLKPVKNRFFLNENKIGNWITISGCKEDQTSSDAMFNGRFNGACSLALWATLEEALNDGIELTYREWVKRGNEFLKQRLFKQEMTIEGKESLIDSIVFKDPCILVHYSGHGAYTADVHGDELDGLDEALYLYDGMFLDDEMNALLSKIKDN